MGYSRGLRSAIKESIHFNIIRTESLLASRRSADVLTAGVDVTRNVAASPADATNPSVNFQLKWSGRGGEVKGLKDWIHGYYL